MSWSRLMVPLCKIWYALKVSIICRRIYFDSRVIANCIYENGAVTPVGDILEYAEEAKENGSGSPLSSVSLGFIVKDVWGAAIHRARRGPRNQQQSVYFNLSLKTNEPARLNPSNEDVPVPLSQALSNLSVPDESKIIRDKPNCWSIVQVEKWELNSVRAATEIVVEQDLNEGSCFISVKAHGCQKDLSNIPQFTTLPINDRVSLALDNGESIQALFPHVTGSFKDLGNENMSKTTITFSAKCKIFAVSGASCSECNYLLKLHNRKTQRQEKRMGISRNCNKRYHTKEDVVLQLNQERNRSKDWMPKSGKSIGRRNFSRNLSSWKMETMRTWPPCWERFQKKTSLRNWNVFGSNSKKSWRPEVSAATGGIQSKYSSHVGHLYSRARE